ncbi:DUF6998 domain-containing protein [Algiphilus sp.]|uniref:DUF6998 domain-containing protein n=1 Tax=Algiphilus sp. TaxID=1872431 RepID=UPI003BAD7DEA
MDHQRIRALVERIYSAVQELEAMFLGRLFTPDGHMVGSIGECLVADAYDLELMPASNKGYDARSRDGKRVEIKATQSRSVAFRSEPEHTIAIRILRDGHFEELYNGPGHLVWRHFQGKPLPSNGQHQISLQKLRLLNQEVTDADRLPRVA